VSAGYQLSIAGITLAGFWWLLSGGDPGSWLVGLPTLVFALWALHWLGRAGGPLPSPPGLLRFLSFFIAESTCGGLDVARRILAPALRVNPRLACYRTRLRGSGARLLFTNCVNLLPGTLAADLQRDRLRLHLLDAGVDPERGPGAGAAPAGAGGGPRLPRNPPPEVTRPCPRLPPGCWRPCCCCC